MRSNILEVIGSYSWARKGKYGFLMEYVQLCGVDDTLANLCDGSTVSLLSNVMPFIGQQQLANYVSEPVVG